MAAGNPGEEGVDKSAKRARADPRVTHGVLTESGTTRNLGMAKIKLIN